jgi:ABC-type bacteriocin/lantibiotic exporter with double-glycine peptidase domain
MSFAIAAILDEWKYAYMIMIFALTSIAATTTLSSYQQPQISLPLQTATSSIADVPFYSQFKDIASAKWQKVGCGITSLAMIVDYYSTELISVNTMLAQGISAGAYQQNAGWTYAGLISVARKYGLTGSSYDLGKSSAGEAFEQLKKSLSDGPLIASVHYKFDPASTIPHLVVINGIKGDTIYYNDPAAKSGEKQISSADFLKAWKKRFIVVRPVKSNLLTLARA